MDVRGKALWLGGGFIPPMSSLPGSTTVLPAILFSLAAAFFSAASALPSSSCHEAQFFIEVLKISFSLDSCSLRTTSVSLRITESNSACRQRAERSERSGRTVKKRTCRYVTRSGRIYEEHVLQYTKSTCYNTRRARVTIHASPKSTCYNTRFSECLKSNFDESREG